MSHRQGQSANLPMGRKRLGRLEDHKARWVNQSYNLILARRVGDPTDMETNSERRAAASFSDTVPRISGGMSFTPGERGGPLAPKVFNGAIGDASEVFA